MLTHETEVRKIIFTSKVHALLRRKFCTLHGPWELQRLQRTMLHRRSCRPRKEIFVFNPEARLKTKKNPFTHHHDCDPSANITNHVNRWLLFGRMNWNANGNVHGAWSTVNDCSIRADRLNPPIDINNANLFNAGGEYLPSTSSLSDSFCSPWMTAIPKRRRSA